MSDTILQRRSLLVGVGLLAAAPIHAFAAAPKPRVTIQTDLGSIVVELETGKAPITSTNFLRYVDGKKYDGGTFYRASKSRSGPGAGSIQGGPAVRVRRFAPIAHESTRTTGLRHKAGTISMTRNAPGSATSDFFICASPMAYLDAHPGAPGDNQGFAAFGTVVKGMDVVRKILSQPTGADASNPAMKGQMLAKPVTIVRVTRAG